MREQQLLNAPGVEPSMDEMLRDYMRTQPPAAPDPVVIAPVGEVAAAPLPPVAASGG
jgi:general secretion pathway protein D